MEAFSTTDFRDDLAKVTVPTLVIHGDSDAIVPLEGAGKRTHQSIEGSQLVVLEGAPHGCNASHVDEFNRPCSSSSGGAAQSGECTNGRNFVDPVEPVVEPARAAPGCW